MSAVSPTDASHASAAGPKKKNNKKKKSAKSKVNGDVTKVQEAEEDVDNAELDIRAENTESRPAGITDKAVSAADVQVNGHLDNVLGNGYPVLPPPPSTADEDKFNVPNGRTEDEDTGGDPNDASARLEAMSQERQALRAEVEQLRKALEDIQGRHREELATVRTKCAEELSSTQKQPVANQEASVAEEELRAEVSTVRQELEESETAKEQAQIQYQNLLGRVNTIKATLGERLKADKQELEEAKVQIEELESHNEALQQGNKDLETTATRLQKDISESSKELSSLRNRHNLSQQNWVHEREDLVQETKQLRNEAEAAKEAMGDWEVLAMEERSVRANLEARVTDMEDQFSSQKEALEAAISDRDSNTQGISGLQRALQEIQETRKRELREMVETTEEQVVALKKLVQESDTRATAAEASRGALQTELDRLAPFEKEVKEKNLLIGKLRHEAIVLNDHLTKALRFLKRAKPEDNIDRQIVTNHFLHFLALDRSDPKKFQILQLIAALLNWNDDQREQAGLARPGTSSSSLRLPASPFHRTPSVPALSADYFAEPPASKESLADLWTGFLERSAEEGSTKDNSRNGSVSSSSRRPETREGTREGTL